MSITHRHPLVLGTNVFGWTADRSTSFEVLDRFVELGGRSIDTADMYSQWVDGHAGHESERIIGDWIHERANRADVIVGTKVGQLDARPGLSGVNVAAAIDESLRALRTDYVDIYWAHIDDPSVLIDEAVVAMHSLVTAGKARHIGLSNFSGTRAAEWIARAESFGFEPPRFVQPSYNLLDRSGFEDDLLPVAERHELTTYAYFALASGLLTGKFRSLDEVRRSARADITEQFATGPAFAVVDEVRTVAGEVGVSPARVALAWLASRPTVGGVLASARTVEQLDDLMGVVDVALDASQLERLDRVSEPLRSSRS